MQQSMFALTDDGRIFQRREEIWSEIPGPELLSEAKPIPAEGQEIEIADPSEMPA